MNKTYNEYMAEYYKYWFEQSYQMALIRQESHKSLNEARERLYRERQK